MGKSVIVIGAGAWGGWSAYKLQEAGFKVTLIDKSEPGNVFSGSGGKTRIIRMAYGGHAEYTEMVQNSFEAWARYEAQWNEALYHPKGALWMFRGIKPTYAETSIPLMAEKGYRLEEMTVEELQKQYPSISFDDITSAYWEPDVWYLEAAKSCQVVAKQFEQIGGRFIQAEVTSIATEDKLVKAVLADGGVIEADQMVLASGPWTKALIPELDALIHVSRQEVYYFDCPKPFYELPIWVEFRAGDQMYYGIPDHFNQGFKFAYDERQWPLDPDLDDRDVTPAILEKMKGILVNRFPDLAHSALLKHHTCVYESSIDGDFIIDKSANGKIIFMAGSSGHGFKMGPAIGQMMVNCFNGGELPKAFGIARFSKKTIRKSQYEMD